MSLNTSTTRSNTTNTSKRNLQPSSPSPPPSPPPSHPHPHPQLVLDLINHYPELRLPSQHYPHTHTQQPPTSPPRMMTPDEFSFSFGSWHNIDIRVPESILSSDGEELDLDSNLPHNNNNNNNNNNIGDALVLESEEEEEEEEPEPEEEEPDEDKLIMPTMTMKSQYKPKITILSNNNANSFIIQCLEGIADIQYSNLDTALTKRDPHPHTMAKTATPTNTTTNTDMVLMVNDDDDDDSNKEIERQIWNNDKLNNDHGYYSYSYHDPLGVIFIDNWSLLFGFSIGLGLGIGIAFGMVSMVEKLLPQTSSIIPDASTSCPGGGGGGGGGGDGGDFNKEMNYLTSISKKIVEYIKGGWVIVLKIFS